MQRREFITLLGGAAAWPIAARGQQRTMPVVGWLNSGSALATAARLNAFQQGLRGLGYVENQNVVIEYRWADGQYERAQRVLCYLYAPCGIATSCMSTLVNVPIALSDRLGRECSRSW